MRVILSRKGFDSSVGGCPSPILPNGTMLSLPIPRDGSVAKGTPADAEEYGKLFYNGMSYERIIKWLAPSFDGVHCHLDPDIRRGLRKEPDG